MISGEKQQLQERRKELIKETKEENVNLQKFHEDTFDLDENKAITLKEAYDRAITKVEQCKFGLGSVQVLHQQVLVELGHPNPPPPPPLHQKNNYMVRHTPPLTSLLL